MFEIYRGLVFAEVIAYVVSSIPVEIRIVANMDCFVQSAIVVRRPASPPSLPTKDSTSVKVIRN